MKLHEAYKRIKKSIVAIIPMFANTHTKTAPDFPEIIGTGFIISDGLVVTNHHVVKYAKEIAEAQGHPEEKHPFVILYWHEISEGMVPLPLSVVGVFTLKDVNVKERYYGPRSFDLAFIRLRVKGLPIINTVSDEFVLKEGMRVATAGYKRWSLMIKGWTTTR